MKQSQSAVPTSEEGMSKSMDEYMKAPDEKMLVAIYDSYISSGSYEDNLQKMGVVSPDAPSAISIYADSFENKDFISECIENYNKSVSEENKITYTDYIGLLMSSVTTIVNVISYVLIAFVAVSLIVSSIMIGIITYISVLERTKEIGILRAIGASKKNISQVFNAETFIIGLFSGLMGIGITLLMLIPINEIIHAVAESPARRDNGRCEIERPESRRHVYSRCHSHTRSSAGKTGPSMQQREYPRTVFWTHA